MDSEQCPLCGKSDHMHKAKPLYNHLVCKKCYYKFANRRQFAFFIDSICWRLLTLPLFLALGFALGVIGVPTPAVQGIAFILAYFLLLIFICKDSFSGHSPGKALMGVRAVDKASGMPIGIGASFKRNLPLMIPFMPLIVAVRLCKGHRAGDGWSNSKVIWKKYAASPVFLPVSDPLRDS